MKALLLLVHSDSWLMACRPSCADTIPAVIVSQGSRCVRSQTTNAHRRFSHPGPPPPPPHPGPPRPRPRRSPLARLRSRAWRRGIRGRPRSIAVSAPSHGSDTGSGQIRRLDSELPPHPAVHFAAPTPPSLSAVTALGPARKRWAARAAPERPLPPPRINQALHPRPAETCRKRPAETCRKQPAGICLKRPAEICRKRRKFAENGRQKLAGNGRQKPAGNGRQKLAGNGRQKFAGNRR